VPKNKPHHIFQSLNMHGGNPSVCWEWTRPVGSSGRPQFDLNGRKVLAYRLVWELINGRKLTKGEVIRHQCDNPLCCNPSHLVVGSHQENMNDMKERARHGLPHHTVKAIKRLLEKGVPQAEIAERFGISARQVSHINTGNAYKEVETEMENAE
jgi:HNH endonuclease